APVLAQLLRPVQATGLRVLGVVSDAQESVRLAVAEVFPGVPHQLCQYHALREATALVWEADRHLLVQVKKELRALREVEERTRQRATERQATGQAPDPIDGVVLDTVLALRQVVRERGTQPLDFGALRVLDQLAALGQTLDRGLANRGRPDSPACGRSGLGRWPLGGRRPPTCASSTPGWSTWRTAWSPTRSTRPAAGTALPSAGRSSGCSRSCPAAFPPGRCHRGCRRKPPMWARSCGGSGMA